MGRVLVVLVAVAVADGVVCMAVLVFDGRPRGRFATLALGSAGAAVGVAAIGVAAFGGRPRGRGAALLTTTDAATGAVAVALFGGRPRRRTASAAAGVTAAGVAFAAGSLGTTEAADDDDDDDDPAAAFARVLATRLARSAGIAAMLFGVESLLADDGGAMSTRSQLNCWYCERRRIIGFFALLSADVDEGRSERGQSAAGGREQRSKWGVFGEFM